MKRASKRAARAFDTSALRASLRAGADRHGTQVPVPAGERMRGVRPALLPSPGQPAARDARGRRRAVGARADGGRADPLQPARRWGRWRWPCWAPAWGPVWAGSCAGTLRTAADRRAADRGDQRARLSRRADRVRAARRPRPVRAGRPDGRGGRLWRGDRAEGDAADADHDAREPRGRPRRAVAGLSPAVIPLGADRIACRRG